MSSVVSLDARRRRDEAVEWFVRANDRDASDEDLAAVEAWLGEGPENREAYLRVMESWQRASAHDEALEAILADGEAGQVKPFWRTPAVRLGALAASLLVAVLVGLFTVFGGPEPVQYATPFGETRQIALEDGTTIDLYADTAITVTMGGIREVELSRGRAFFSVTPDRQRPFEVRAMGHTVRVVGTRFALAVSATEADLQVEEGHVVLNDGITVHLMAGETVSYTERGPTGPVSRIDPARVAQWRAGQFFFDREPLAAAIGEFNRFYGNIFSISEPQLGQLTISGVFQQRGPADTIAALEAILPIRADPAPDGRFIIRPNPESGP